MSEVGCTKRDYAQYSCAPKCPNLLKHNTKLSNKQQKELCRMHGTGDYSIGDLAELFSVSRPTVYRTLVRNRVFNGNSTTAD
ncbi:helix-turn-helix domain-containing protein [Xenorhabdus koppenhoeferi]|uniref:helix-turn-helix domain-containing protein n=1 Tax=Xenorhabdus koppenhoeferi TaxID=351659 RepID=UPI001160A8A8|nr:helix-turn-helix domain-containing protein [Xenorhabdus koppenhoeferi]